MYQRPRFLVNGHLETIYPAIFRSVEIAYQRERISTPDDDFLDLDWLYSSSDKLVIISHGLEGNSKRAYVGGMARAFQSAGYNVLAWNYRGCSEEMNRRLRFYHSGATDDLEIVIKHAIEKSRFNSFYLIGFSLGGNITLKYLGEKGRHVAPEIKGAVTFSVPLHLHSSCIKISRPSNWIYARRFLISLKKKVTTKAKVYSELNVNKLANIATLIDFDDAYTAPLHGFNTAVEYYEKCSSLYFIEAIQKPTLIVNAQNDPFLSEKCFLKDKSNSFVQFENPIYGGHCGFSSFNPHRLYWSEKRALAFLSDL